MKTTDSRDPLDREIDALLSERPVHPSPDFLARTLEAAEAIEQEQPTPKKSFRIIPLAMPIAAVLVMSLFLASQLKDDASSTAPNAPQIATNKLSSKNSDVLQSAEMQEILFLQEGLSGLASIETTSLDDDDLIQALDTLYIDIQS